MEKNMVPYVSSRLQQLPAELRIQIYEWLGFPTTIDVLRNEMGRAHRCCDIWDYTLLWYNPAVLPMPAAKDIKGRYHAQKANSFTAKGGILDRGALSLLRSSRFFFSELCPLLYKRTILSAEFDNIPLLELGNTGSMSPTRQTNPKCSPSYRHALQNIPHVAILLPSWNLIGSRPNDGHYFSSMLLVLRRSLTQVYALLPSLRELYVHFPWDRLDLVSHAMLRDFFSALSNVILSSPKLQSIMLHNWRRRPWKHLWIGFVNREQSLWDRKKKMYIVWNEKEEVRDGQRAKRVADYLMQVLKLKPWTRRRE